jgi:oligopeptide/dipeptide ABC transporter ATP-binding protein
MGVHKAHAHHLAVRGPAANCGVVGLQGAHAHHLAVRGPAANCGAADVQPTPTDAGPPVLELRDVVTEIRGVRGLVRPVDGVSLTVRAGQVVGLVGESGSGKSMTAFSVMRLFPTKAARVTGGEILLRGGDGRVRDLRTLGPDALRAVRGREIGMIFQDPASYLNPVLTVGRQLEQQLQAHALGQGADARIAELLTDVGLSPEVARRYAHELSGGQCQRVGIASALACRPALVVADEPTTALDVTIQAQVLRLLARLQRERGVAMLLITHDLGVVAEVCDHVYVMYAGRIVEEGPVEDLFARPRHPYTQGLLAGVLDLLEPRPIRVSIEGSVPDLVRPPPGCRFHPRCPHAMPVCAREAPPLLPRGEAAALGHSACWLHDPAVVGAAAAVGPGPEGGP